MPSLRYEQLYYVGVLLFFVIKWKNVLWEGLLAQMSEARNAQEIKLNKRERNE